MNESKKRQRSENWVSSDRMLLRHLVKGKISIIENKSVDTNTSVAKRFAWKKILEAFNKCSSVRRNLEQIKGQWRAIRYAKGYVPPPKSPDVVDFQVMALISGDSQVNQTDLVDGNSKNSVNESKTVEYITDEKPKNGTEESLAEAKTEDEMKDYYLVEVEPENGTKEYLNDAKPKNETHSSTTTSKTSKPSSSKQTKAPTEAPDTQRMKMELFEIAKEAKRKEMEFMRAEHVKKIRVLEMELMYKKQAFENNERRAEQEHQLRMKLMQEKNEK